MAYIYEIELLPGEKGQRFHGSAEAAGKAVRALANATGQPFTVFRCTVAPLKHKALVLAMLNGVGWYTAREVWLRVRPRASAILQDDSPPDFSEVEETDEDLHRQGICGAGCDLCQQEDDEAAAETVLDESLDDDRGRF